MKQARWCAVLLLAVGLLSCATVPISGRKQIKLIPGGEMLSMSSSQYAEFIKSNKLSTDVTQTQTVRRVGERIRGAVEQYFAGEGMANRLDGYKWEFNLVESQEVNAWCMPGGKVVVYTGILPLTQTEAGLAVVLGHEIAHAIADHGNERMSQQLLAAGGGMLLSEALRKEPQKTQDLWLTVFGVGAQYGALLPFSRAQETEADDLGLIFMAMAGYDPNEALTFWGRMTQASAGKAPPEFMSTHPSDVSRIENIKGRIPGAMAHYNKQG
jgi:predicted Zn-dependent protease